jgi:TRAP-type C4-dicarboxylate transport system permease small subunit
MSFVQKMSGSFNVMAGAAMTYVLLVSVADIVMNKVFKNPLNWAFDSIGLIAVLATVFAIPEVQSKHGHIEVDALVSRLSKFWKRISGFFVSVLGVALWGVIAWRSFIYGCMWDSGDIHVRRNVNLPVYFHTGYLCNSGSAGPDNPDFSNNHREKMSP